MIVKYDTEEGIFEFDGDEVLEIVSIISRDHGVREAKKLERFLQKAESSIVNVPFHYDYMNYIVLELASRNRGKVFCKKCNKKYSMADIEHFEIGSGKSPLSKKRGLTGFLQGLPRRMGAFGGKEFRCPMGHVLISKTTWIS